MCVCDVGLIRALISTTEEMLSDWTIKVLRSDNQLEVSVEVVSINQLESRVSAAEQTQL